MAFFLGFLFGSLFGGKNSNSINVSNTIVNNFLSKVKQSCTAVVDTSASGNTIIISGTVQGNVEITARGTASASCIMSNKSEETANNLISNLLTQEITNASGIFGDLFNKDMSNNVNITNVIRNNITQITTQACSAVANVQANDNFVWVQSGGVVSGGNISIDATADAAASCNMSNMSKIDAYNQIQNNVSQSETEISMLAIIAIGIVVIILICGIVFIMMYSKRSVGKAVSSDPFANGTLDATTFNQLVGKNPIKYESIAKKVK